MASNARKFGMRVFRACARRYGKAKQKRYERREAATSAVDTSSDVHDEVFVPNLVMEGHVVWLRDVQFAHVEGAGMDRVVTFSTNALDAFSMWYHHVANPYARGATLVELLRARCPVHPKRNFLFLFDGAVDRNTPGNVILRITYVLGDDTDQEHTLAYSLYGNQHMQFPLYSCASQVHAYPRVEYADAHMERFMGPFRNFYMHNQARYNVYLHDVYGPRARQLQSVATMAYRATEEGDADEMTLLLHEQDAPPCSLTTVLELHSVHK